MERETHDYGTTCDHWMHWRDIGTTMSMPPATCRLVFNRAMRKLAIPFLESNGHKPTRELVEATIQSHAFQRWIEDLIRGDES